MAAEPLLARVILKAFANAVFCMIRDLEFNPLDVGLSLERVGTLVIGLQTALFRLYFAPKILI